LNVIKTQLPKILLKDPALKALDTEAKPGDVVEIHRVSESAGANKAYRIVVEE
jgi:DNA-directed RNA polymerase subunit H (RpoH/RPB5)